MARHQQAAPVPAARRPAPRSAPRAPEPAYDTNLGGDVVGRDVVGDGMEVQRVDIGSHTSRNSVMNEPAVTEEELSVNYGPPVKKYEVLNGGRVQTAKNGQRTYLPVGKIIDTLNYDVPLMRQQGIKLRELSAEEIAPQTEAADEFGE